jgi:predicted nucleic acid-binding protein
LQDRLPVRALLKELGPGESEAIALTSQLTPPPLIVLDDRKARLIARAWELSVTGGAGILVLAKDVGLIPAARPLLEDLRSAGLYMSDARANEVLDIIGE